MSSQSQWQFRFPRKKRARSVGELPGKVARRLDKKNADIVMQSNQRPACAPATSSGANLVENSHRFAVQSQTPTGDVTEMARRLAKGRTMQAWSLLANTRLFQFDSENALPMIGIFQPKRGLQATHKTYRVHILDTFTKWRRPFADVAKVIPNGEFWTLGRVQQVRCEDLMQVRFDYVAELGPRGGVRLRLPERGDYPTVRPDLISALIGGPRPCAPGGTKKVVTGQNAVKTVVPMTAIRHMEQTLASGRPHYTSPTERCAGVRYVMDFPFPLPFEAKSHWCRHCSRQGMPMCNEDAMALHEWVDESVGEKSACYWSVEDDDIRRAFPTAVVYRPSKQAPIWCTAQFIMELCTLFYETLNARQVRRQIAAIYTANALAEQLRQQRDGTAPYVMSWVLAAVPNCKQLRPLIYKAFAAFVQARVRIMRRRQMAYNAQGLRHDGNFDLAKILSEKVNDCKCTVVVAVCGTDGSLIDVPSPLPTEGWPHLRKMLEPLLRDIQTVRLECGYGMEGSMPVFHATDVFEKHARCMRRLYGKVWSGMRVSAGARTPKGSTGRREVLPTELVEGMCTITGEPMHCIINLRRLVSPQCNDASNFIFDYSEIINRLSMEDGPVVDKVKCGPPVLDDEARALLLQSVKMSAHEFAAACKRAKESISLRLLKAFIMHAEVRDAEVWMAVFGARPPRGSLARIARRLGVELHPRSKAYGWETKEDFCKEVRRLRTWYKPGRRETRRRRGIIRGVRSAGRLVKGRKSVMTKKVKAHLRKLTSDRKLAGLWYWRQMARALRAAGIPVHTGTVPVERLWNSLQDFFPRASRRMSLPWWTLLARLSYMRFNYRHFNHAVLPTFTDGDALLAERIENLIVLTREMQACAEGDDAVLQALRSALS